jgi:hypothetical protein
MTTGGPHSRTVDFETVVGPSRWWELPGAAEDVPPEWNSGAWTCSVHATSDEREQVTATHVESARRSTASWDGDLENLSVVRGPADTTAGEGYRIAWTFRRGTAPRVEVSGPDDAQVSSYATSLKDRLSPRMEGLANEDAAAAPPGRAGQVWPKLDRLGTVIAVGISVIVVLAVAGAIWAWASR